ncbi:MAG TPA: DNA recombination protein RmuC [Candidatus Methylomirabilis sp.]|nr:DNA recombination protein RmuC [Candidatus Methylomirabilis sp.]
MDNLFPILLLIGIGVVIYLLLRKKGGISDEKIAVMMERLTNLSAQNEEMRKALDAKLSEAYKTTQDQFGKTAGLMQGVTGQANKMMMEMHAQSQKVITEVSEKLAKLDETNKQVINFSGQLQNLQDILKNPKQRGVLGEYFLEETLKNVLPPGAYEMQYKLGKDKEGAADLIVDAVVFVKDKIIPIDSKFSLENYQKILDTNDAAEREALEKLFRQDLKNRIDETSKYIKPQLGTMDFAFMFIPSEAIYYDLLINKVGAVKTNTRALIEYAFRDKKVIIVSPTSFLAYLQTVLQGLKAMKIEETAKEIQANVEKLGRHLIAYDDYFHKLGNSLSTTVNHYNSAYKEFKKVDKDVIRITGGESDIEPLELERPKNNEE